MEVEHAVIVGLGDLLRQQKAAGQIPAHLTGNVVSLGGGNGGVLVGVLLGQILVVVADQSQNGLVGGVGLAHQSAGIAVDDVGLGQLILVRLHQALLHHILYVLHQQTLAGLAGHGVGNGFNGSIVQAIWFLHRQVGLLNGQHDLTAVKVHGRAVSLDYFHALRSFSRCFVS